MIPSASADQISNLKAQAAALAAKINALGMREDALAQRYDAAQLQVSDLQAKVKDASAKLASAQAATDKARQALRADAIQAYVNGGRNPLQAGSSLVQGADNSLLRAEYINTLVTNQNNAIDQYRVASLQEQTAQADLKRQESAAQQQMTQLASDRNAVAQASTQLTSMEGQVKGQLAQAIAQQQAAAAAAAAAAEQQRLAAAAAAAAAARAAQAAAAAQAAPSPVQSVTSGSAGGASASVTSYNPPPPAGAGASGAVAAAETRLGDWYQWGATGPSTFDCSGLVMWAYAQVGISLPHYSGAQYADTTHIPMSDLQPGDLVFFSNPGEHVAMYVGNGQVIEAAHTGTQVHIVPMYSGFTLASRVR
ncbi:MAG TPA: NlpC/P60 family protein [Acidimicrobiales bacterium]|nr:NlpC/P60 family protein [Acidimicrobiales bacterium]